MSTLIGSFRWLSQISADFEKLGIRGVVFSQDLDNTCGMLRF